MAKGRHRRPCRTAPVIAAGKTALAVSAVAGTAAAAVHAPPAAAAPPGRMAVTAPARQQAVPGRVDVRAGDTLSGIARRYCGSLYDWPGIYAANRELIGGNPNAIVPGQVLVLHCARGPVPRAVPPRGQQQAVVTAHVVTSAMSGFQECVITRESGGNRYAQNPSSTASGLYGFLNTTWTAVTGLPGPARAYSVAEQDAAFEKLYAEAGTSPWAPYDGC
jgi:hypothetical protein